MSIGQWNTITTLRNQGKYSNIVFESFWLGNFYESIVHSLYWYDPEMGEAYDYAHNYVVGSIRPVIIISRDSIQ